MSFAVVSVGVYHAFAGGREKSTISRCEVKGNFWCQILNITAIPCKLQFSLISTERGNLYYNLSLEWFTMLLPGVFHAFAEKITT